VAQSLQMMIALRKFQSEARVTLEVTGFTSHHFSKILFMKHKTEIFANLSSTRKNKLLIKNG